MEIRTLFLFLATKLLMPYLVACLSMTIPNITTDQSALLALKSSLILDPNSILVTNWTIRTLVCNWIGVVCGHRHKRVVALNIPSMGVVGTIPPNLGNLSFLVQLNMYDNSFYGHLPEDLAKLRRLKFLSVRLNNLTGQVPSWLGSLRNLKLLLLGNNSFTGKIPYEIGNLRDLRSGEVPPSLHRCSELEEMSLSVNNFTGPMTSGFGNLTKLEQLYIGGNHIQGSLPSGIGNCTNLKQIYLTYNNFAGFEALNLEFSWFQTASATSDLVCRSGYSFVSSLRVYVISISVCLYGVK
ncbi:hypothetical protein Acr_19g0000610 [Actinidia rufa]|uniref:Leucine-rich repeat-containing N-terminal plant-type domain-containing protein n=1 Tax=Actinidia rufa TaxID=165716 RepID=A0A7J0G8J3_9ERIC|nr:hypothetical protein Acr_19g0000610 [Actinidia rufa]